MKKKALSILLLSLFLVSTIGINKVYADSHCQAGFTACMGESGGADDANDCVDAWLTCIGYDEK